MSVFSFPDCRVAAGGGPERDRRLLLGPEQRRLLQPAAVCVCVCVCVILYNDAIIKIILCQQRLFQPALFPRNEREREREREERERERESERERNAQIKRRRVKRANYLM